MAGPIHGSLEHYFAGTGLGTGSNNVAFVNIYRFLNNNTGSLGIRRIAYNTGSTPTGASNTRDMNYFDEANPAGGNAWACFYFSSASIPFNILIQTANGLTFGNAPGSPGLYRGTTTTAGVGIAFAQRADGGDCWNGSSGSNGYDTKGTPVWNARTSSMALYPRSNDGIRGGSHATSKQNTIGIGVGANTDFRMSLVADYDNFCWVHDATADVSYETIMFGIYTPISGISPDIPYFCMTSAGLPITVTTYGDLAGTSTTNGGISYPNLALSGTCILGNDRYGTTFFSNVYAAPNRAFATPRYDEHPILLGINESPNQVGIMGQAYEFFREVYNIATHDTNGDGSRAAFGNTTLANIKLTIPWDPGVVPGSGLTRTGYQF